MPKSLAEELAVEPPRVNAKEQCALAERVGSASSLDDADRAAITAALNNARWSARALGDVLARYGVAVSFSAIASHRRGACACSRKVTA